MQTTLDLSAFRWIDSQTSGPDRLALLSIREVICTVAERYTYLEVGSHLGGSLQPHVIDSRCVSVLSIDPRPLEQPDERWADNYRYDGNSTQRMLALLSAIPGADTGKITTFESCSWDVSDESIPASVDYAFIDGEHTNEAVRRDFSAVRRFLGPRSVLAFHDSFVTPSAFFKISGLLRREHPASRFVHYPDSGVVAVTFGSPELEGALLKHGWKQGLPYSRSIHIRNFKTYVRKHWPRFFSLLARCKAAVCSARLGAQESKG